MIVLIGGMYRSGSTFAFNIVREILNANGISTSLEKLEDAIELAEHPNLLLKSHTPDDLTSKLIKLGGVKCICTYRKPEEAISSWMNTFGFTLEQSVEYMKQWIEWHRTVKHVVLNVPYEKIENSPFHAILDMQTYLTGRLNIASSLKLRFKYDKRRLRKIYQSLPEGQETESVGFSYYDKETFFHRGHISQAAHKLTEEQAEVVRDAFRQFSDAHGNYIV
jgi:hypothetical protein